MAGFSPSNSRTAAPSGAAGGVLSGTYPDPGFAVDMATQAELDTLAAAAVLDGDAAGGDLDGTYPNPTLDPLLVAAKVRDQARKTAQGFIDETFDRRAGGGDETMADGRAYFVMVGLLAGDVATSCSLQVLIAGADMTLSKVGLYSKDGTRRAISADQGAAWQSTGLKTVNFAAPFAVTVTDGYYLAIIAKASTTLPTLNRGGSGSDANGAAVGAGKPALGTQDAQTDLPASAVIAPPTTSDAQAFWLAVS